MASPHKRTPKKRSQSVGKKFEKLVALQARLLAPGGCPWDREQTHESLRTYLLEETYEVLDALQKQDFDKLSSELGDLLLQIVFHAELAADAGRFDIGDVVERIHTKMVRRHPHVFGKVRAADSAQVLKNWEQLKAEERRAEKENAAEKQSHVESLLHGIPRSLPALMEAHQLTRRAARIGFDWENIAGLLDKLEEETEELRRALREAKDAKNGRVAKLEEEAGDLLFVAANIARFLGFDPEITLHKANGKFIRRFQQMETEAKRNGKQLAEVSREDLEALWEQSKSRSPER